MQLTPEQCDDVMRLLVALTTLYGHEAAALLQCGNETAQELALERLRDIASAQEIVAAIAFD